MKRKHSRPKKSLGQHFLYDPAIARKIVSAAGVSADDNVIELGAGRGIMTKALAECGARVIALELDGSLHQELSEHFAGSDRVEVLHQDFTKVSLTSLLTERGLDKCALVGNIPYHHTRHVLFAFLVDEFEVIGRSYLMVQREVGERIVSPPGSRVYGITSVILQSLYDTRIATRVAPGSFNPRPKVASVVLEFKPLAVPLVNAAELDAFSRFVKNLFQQRRKTIQNTMKAFYTLPDAALGRIHETTQIDLALRPEQLSKEQFLELLRSLAEVTQI